MQAHGSTLVDASPERAFAFVADPANDTRWRSHLVSSRGTVRGLGDTVSQTYSYQGRTHAVTMEVSEYEPPDRISFVIHEPVRVRMAFQFKREDGGCRVSVSLSSMLSGAATIVEGRITTEAQKLIATDLQRLRIALTCAEEM